MNRSKCSPYDGGRFGAGFDVAELAVDHGQLGPDADGAYVGELASGATSGVFGFAHHAAAGAGLLLSRIDREQANVAALAVELEVNACDDNFVFRQQEKLPVAHQLAYLRFVGAVSGLEEKLDGEGAIDEIDDDGNIGIGCRAQVGGHESL